SLLLPLMRLTNCGNNNKAQIEYTERAFEMRRKLPGFKVNGNSAPIANVLAQLYLDSSNTERAEHFAKEACSLSEALFGRGSGHHLWCKCTFAMVKIKEGKKAEGEAILDENFKEAQKLNSLYEIEVLTRSVNVLLKYGFFQRACEIADLAENKSRKFLEDCDPELQLARDQLDAVCNWHLGRHAKAEQLISIYLTDLNKFYPEKSGRIKVLKEARKSLQDAKLFELAKLLPP
ncbi:MAG: hypothetical protein K2X27_14835, partial [Candidatus Obscuribacterales bacterium]|nr:hypothetical protein [Candidatus Obscuribacterales bacterium]